jgi:hypothetical protein
MQTSDRPQRKAFPGAVGKAQQVTCRIARAIAAHHTNHVSCRGHVSANATSSTSVDLHYAPINGMNIRTCNFDVNLIRKMRRKMEKREEEKIKRRKG